MYVHLIPFPRAAYFRIPSTSFVIMPSVGARMPGFTAPRLSDLRGALPERGLSSEHCLPWQPRSWGQSPCGLLKGTRLLAVLRLSRMQVRSVQSDADAAACRAEKPDKV